MLICIDMSLSLNECSLEVIMLVLLISSSSEAFEDSFRCSNTASVIATMALEPTESIPREFMIGSIVECKKMFMSPKIYLPSMRRSSPSFSKSAERDVARDSVICVGGCWRWCGLYLCVN